jgi:hypothetical protein
MALLLVLGLALSVVDGVATCPHTSLTLVLVDGLALVVVLGLTLVVVSSLVSGLAFLRTRRERNSQ